MIEKRLLAIAIALGASHQIARAQTADVAPSTEVKKIESIKVVGQRLDEARNALSPETGSTIYRFDRKDIENLPLGDSTPLNQVVLQAPGVVQDSFGQVHVRGDHANLQYRIDGIVIPESISGFGQAFDARFAERINILTGALPAQYGYRTAGVKPVALADTSAGPFVQLSRKSVTDRSYPLSRPVYLVYTIDNEKSEIADPRVDPKVREFLRYILSRQGQQDVVRDGAYLPLPLAIVREQLKKLDSKEPPRELELLEE